MCVIIGQPLSEATKQCASLLVRTSFHAAARHEIPQLMNEVRYGLHSNEWKRTEADTLLVVSAKGVGVCGGVGSNVALLYMLLCSTYHRRGTSCGSDTR